jgi:hypothetical protein
MKTTRIIYFLIALQFLISSCEKMDDFSLSETIFIEDPYSPGLPVYSEWGYNTFGAYIDRKPFVSSDYELPSKVIVNSDTLHLILRGMMGSEEIDLKFSLKGYSPATHYELIQMDNSVINLKEAGRTVTLKTRDEVSVLELIEGELEVKKVQRLYVDEEMTRTIMSGRFSFKTFLNNEPVSVSFGRFDLGIGYENFYNF